MDNRQKEIFNQIIKKVIDGEVENVIVCDDGNIFFTINGFCFSIIYPINGGYYLRSHEIKNFNEYKGIDSETIPNDIAQIKQDLGIFANEYFDFDTYKTLIQSSYKRQNDIILYKENYMTDDEKFISTYTETIIDKVTVNPQIEHEVHIWAQKLFTYMKLYKLLEHDRCIFLTVLDMNNVESSIKFSYIGNITEYDIGFIPYITENIINTAMITYYPSIAFNNSSFIIFYLPRLINDCGKYFNNIIEGFMKSFIHECVHMDRWFEHEKLGKLQDIILGNSATEEEENYVNNKTKEILKNHKQNMIDYINNIYPNTQYQLMNIDINANTGVIRPITYNK